VTFVCLRAEILTWYASDTKQQCYSRDCDVRPASFPTELRTVLTGHRGFFFVYLKTSINWTIPVNKRNRISSDREGFEAYLRCSCNMFCRNWLTPIKSSCSQSWGRYWNAWPLKYKTQHLDDWGRQWT